MKFAWLLLVSQLAACGGDQAGHRRLERSAEDVIKRKLRIVTLNHVPYTNVTEGENGLRYVGFIPDLIHELSRRLHFSYEFYLSPGGTYGTEQADGSWSGLIGEVILNKHDPDGNISAEVNPNQPGADIAAAPLLITSKRQTMVDYLHPFHNLGMSILVRKASVADNSTEKWLIDFSILKPLSPSVWGMIFLTSFVVGLLLFAMNYFNPYEWGGRYNRGLADVNQKDSFCLTGSLWFVFSTLQWQGFERVPRSVASKILTCFWFAFVTLTLVTYIGGLVNHLWWASMVHRQTDPPISDLEDLVSGAGHEFKYGTQRTWFVYKYITEVGATRKAEFQTIANYWQTEEGRQQLVDSLDEGLHKVRNEKYALIVDSMTARWEVNQNPCDLTTVGEPFGLRTYGLAVPKNWPYLDQFNRAILELKEEGVIDDMEQRWWEGRGDCWKVRQNEKVMQRANNVYITDSEPRVVSMDMFWGQLVLMVVGIALTFIAFMAEILYYRYKGKYLATTQQRGLSVKLENEDGNI